MSHLLGKSKCNLKVAEALIENNDLYHSSIHCSYYACFQLIKHILTVIRKPAVEVPRENAHTFVRQKIFYFLGEHDRTAAIYFNNEFVNLHTCRLDCDYENMIIDHERARKAFKIAKKVCLDLTVNFIE